MGEWRRSLYFVIKCRHTIKPIELGAFILSVLLDNTSLLCLFHRPNQKLLEGRQPFWRRLEKQITIIENNLKDFQQKGKQNRIRDLFQWREELPILGHDYLEK